MRKVKRTAIICEFEKALTEFDKVLVFLPECGASLVKHFLKSDAYVKQCCCVRVYIPEVLGGAPQEGIRIISEQELEEILNLFRLYEFTDNLQVIGESQNFGGLLNYVKTGVLTEMEFFEAFFS